MIVFITGGSGCGKSAFAEKVAVCLGGKRIYIATMPVYSEEDMKKVERHHKLRAGKGFETLERPKLLLPVPDQEETVLIECMSTHTANMLYDPDIDFSALPAAGSGEEGEAPSDSFYIEKIRQELKPVLNRNGHTIFVSAETALDGVAYDEVTERYKRVLTAVNSFLAEQADAVFEVVCGIPVRIKGDLCV